MAGPADQEWAAALELGQVPVPAQDLAPELGQVQAPVRELALELVKERELVAESPLARARALAAAMQAEVQQESHSWKKRTSRAC
jgi:hypothetical protein